MIDIKPGDRVRLPHHRVTGAFVTAVAVGKRYFLGNRSDLTDGSEMVYDLSDDWEKLPEPKPWDGVTEERWATLTSTNGRTTFYTYLKEPSHGLPHGKVRITPIEGTWKMPGEE